MTDSEIQLMIELRSDVIRLRSKIKELTKPGSMAHMVSDICDKMGKEMTKELGKYTDVLREIVEMDEKTGWAMKRKACAVLGIGMDKHGFPIV